MTSSAIADGCGVPREHATRPDAIWIVATRCGRLCFRLIRAFAKAAFNVSIPPYKIGAEIH